MAASQVGKSELINNVIGYSIHQDPCPILLVQPTEQVAEKYSKKRIAPMISSSPVLRELVGEGKTRDSSNTLLSKEFPAGSLTLVGSNAASGVASLAVRRGLVDELDRCSPDVGGEGDLLGLVRARLSTFTTTSQLVLVSTPTILGTSPIALAYADTDQREYEVPCPSCGTFQTLQWKQVRYPKDQPDKAEYYCSHCGDIIPESAKPTMLELGEWIPRNPGHPIPGFFISGLLSPWVSWQKIATEFVAAAGSPTRLQAWVNTRLGECWDPHDTETLEPRSIRALREDYTVDPLPEGVVVVTVAVDTQDDRLELEYVGWGLGAECWHLDLLVLNGDPSAGAVWNDLDNALMRSFTTASGVTISVAVTLIDSGGHHTQAVYDFCRVRQKSRKVYAIKGVSGVRPLWNRRPSRTAKGGNLSLFLVGVDTGKDDRRQALISTMARRDPGEGKPEKRGPGMIHWRECEKTYNKAYFEQLVSESPRVKYHKGRPQRVWHLPKGHRNEAFDLDVYNRAALEAWKAHGYSLEATAAKQAANAQTAQSTAASVVPPPANKPIMTALAPPPAPAAKQQPAEPEPTRARRRTSNRLPSFFGGRRGR